MAQQVGLVELLADACLRVHVCLIEHERNKEC